MINNERSYASLSSGLLARKGAAKPAMRPQGFTGFEDLGWNDMGHAAGPEAFEADGPEHVPSSIAALTPAPRHPKAEEPEVVAQQRAIAQSFEADVDGDAEVDSDPVAEADPVEAPAAAEIVPLPRREVPVPAVASGRKAAFTLRLDAERHLRLRLATAVTGRSAQQIVTGALDALLGSIPEVEALAERAGPAKSKRN
jgi:hypothetical protein